METTIEAHLKNFRELHGEEAWKSEVTRLATQAIRTSDKHAAYWKELTKDYDWLDWDALVEAAGSNQIPNNPELMMAELLRRQMPAIKSQAQYDAVVGSLDAVRAVVNAILEGKPSEEADGRKALEMAFEAARVATHATQQLEDVPEAATSEASKAFKEEPAQFTELEDQRRMLAELEAITTTEALNDWYADTKDRRDKIVNQKLRNELLDAIRAKKNSF
jgi:hypothetical protein